MAETEFYRRRIFKRPGGWEKCVQRSGDYVKNKEKSIDWGGIFDLTIIKHVTLKKIIAHNFQYDPHIMR
jgi:hypothetical protein